MAASLCLNLKDGASPILEQIIYFHVKKVSNYANAILILKFYYAWNAMVHGKREENIFCITGDCA
jgi:hypothetical protein